jgi:hypothetical protein
VARSIAGHFFTDLTDYYRSGKKLFPNSGFSLLAIGHKLERISR